MEKRKRTDLFLFSPKMVVLIMFLDAGMVRVNITRGSHRTNTQLRPGATQHHRISADQRNTNSL